MTQRMLGPIYVSIAASLWGLSAALAKLFFTNNIDPLLVVQTRSSFSFLLLIPVAIFKRELLILNPRLLLKIVPLGVIGLAGANFTYYYAVAKTTVATAIVLQYTAPILVALYQIIFEKKRLALSEFAIILLVLFGCYATVTGFGSHSIAFAGFAKFLGLLAGVAAAFCWAFFNIYERKLPEIRPGAKIFNTLLFATLFWSLIQTPVALANRILNLNLLLLLFGFAFLSVLLPYVFYLRGLKLSGALASIVTANLEPVMAILSSALLVGEMISLVQLLGGVCVIVGATLFNMKSTSRG